MPTSLNDLHYLSREELIKIWKKFFNKNSPQHARKDFLIKHIAWELQAREKGGLTSQAKKKLDKLSENLAKVKDTEQTEILKEFSCFEIKPGTKLIREYKGEKYEVTALDKGFEYNGKTYKSLSAIANEITGTRWNGKVFFGIKKA